MLFKQCGEEVNSLICQNRQIGAILDMVAKSSRTRNYTFVIMLRFDVKLKMNFLETPGLKEHNIRYPSRAILTVNHEYVSPFESGRVVFEHNRIAKVLRHSRGSDVIHLFPMHALECLQQTVFQGMWLAFGTPLNSWINSCDAHGRFIFMFPGFYDEGIKGQPNPLYDLSPRMDQFLKICQSWPHGFRWTKFRGDAETYCCQAPVKGTVRYGTPYCPKTEDPYLMLEIRPISTLSPAQALTLTLAPPPKYLSTPSPSTPAPVPAPKPLLIRSTLAPATAPATAHTLSTASCRQGESGLTLQPGVMAQPPHGATCPCRAEADGVVPLRGGLAQPWKFTAQEKTLIELSKDFWHKEMPVEAGMEEPRHMSQCYSCHVREDPKRFPKVLGPLCGKQLLVDDYFIESASGVERFMEEPIDLGVDILRRDKKWEGSGLGFPGSINHNGSHFVMHYRLKFSGGSCCWFGKTITNSVGFASSIDGVHWHKEKCKVVAGQGGWMAWGIDQCVTFDKWDRNADARYKMVYNCQKHSKKIASEEKKQALAGHPLPYSLDRPLDNACIATSPDGISWTDHGRKFGGAMDTQACLYHDRAGGNYTFILRQNFESTRYFREIRGTQLTTVSEAAFNENLYRNGKIPFEQITTFYFDRSDKLERFLRQTYSFTRTPYEGLHLGLATMLHWPRLPKPEVWRRGTRERMPMDNVLMYFLTSRDGVRYNQAWIYNRMPLNLGPGRGYHYVQAASQLLTYGGFHWLFYTGSKANHVGRWKEPEHVRLAKYPQDRLSGLTAKAAATGQASVGNVTSRPFLWPSGGLALVVNAHVPAGSACRVRFLQAGGTSGGMLLAERDIRPKQGQEKACVDVGQPQWGLTQMQLQFRLSGSTRLYAYWVMQHACT